MLTTITLLTSLVGGPAAPVAAARLDADRSRVSVWTDNGDDPYQTGRDARVFVRSDRDAYVTIFRVDTDGRVRVLFPRDPWEDNFVRGGREFEVEATRDGDAFYVDDYPGVGYVFAVASPDPFDYDAITTGDHWDYRVVADGRVRGDPYVALTDLAQRIVRENDSDWDYDLVPYYVERHYDYPRFLCYDCHSYASYPTWDPYASSCVRFRIVEFDDPYYYPYRYYGGTRVVFTRPLRPEPRFIFKDRDGVGDDRFVTHARERDRPVNDDTRRGVRGTDVGGRGSIPVPETRRRVPSDDSRRPIQAWQPILRRCICAGAAKPTRKQPWRGRSPSRRRSRMFYPCSRTCGSAVAPGRVSTNCTGESARCSTRTTAAPSPRRTRSRCSPCRRRRRSNSQPPGDTPAPLRPRRLPALRA